VRTALPAIAQAVDVISEHIQTGGRLFYVGAGTSGRLGVLDASESVPTFGVEPGLIKGLIAGGDKALMHSIEGAEDDENAGRNDLLALGLSAKDVVVGIAASGRTPYTLGAIEAANEIGAVTIGLACNDPSPLLERAQIKIGVPVGPEIVAGSTRLKAGTAQKLVLNMLSTASMIKLGKVYDNLMVDVQVTNNKLAHRARQIVSKITGTSNQTARQLLLETNNEVKTAIVVHLKGATPQEARELLTSVNGRLRELIG
jgi:N-acetylmuramic acid 6-phosphate etherase